MRELVKPFLCLLVIAACLVAVAAYVTPIYDYKSGYQKGYHMGYPDGSFGFYNPPEYLSDHSAEYNKGLREGYDEGYTQGRTFPISPFTPFWDPPFWDPHIF